VAFVEVAARGDRGVAALQCPRVFGFALDRDDLVVRVLGDDQIHLARDLAGHLLFADREGTRPMTAVLRKVVTPRSSSAPYESHECPSGPHGVEEPRPRRKQVSCRSPLLRTGMKRSVPRGSAV
jgi:hypothetical protein